MNDAMGRLQRSQAAKNGLSQFSGAFRPPGAQPDHALRHGKNILDPMSHLTRQQFLLCKGGLQSLFSMNHPESDADKRGQVGHRSSMTAVEMPAFSADDPYRPDRNLAAHVEWNQQDLRENEICFRNPVVELLRVPDEDRSVSIERHAARAEIPGCRRAVEGCEQTFEMFPAKHPGGGGVFVKAEPRPPRRL